MKFNPADKSDSIIADIDFLLFGTSVEFNTDYSIEDRTRNVNVALDEVVTELYRADPQHKWDDFTNPDFPLSYNDLVAYQDHYVMLDSSLVVHRVRVKDRHGKYRTLDPKFKSELPDHLIDGTGNPEFYYKIGGAIFPVPIPNYGAVDGVELEFQRGGNHFAVTDTDKSPGFNPQFHQALSIRAAMRYAIANGMREKISSLKDEDLEIKQKIIEFYRMRSPDEQPQLRLKRRDMRGYRLNRGRRGF